MLLWLKAHIRNYFGFSQRETNGFLVLLLLMVLFLAAPSLYKLFLPRYDPTADQQLLNEIIAQLETDEGPANSTKPATKYRNITGKTPSGPFNPNLLSAEEWQALGLSAKLAQRIKNYQAKGGIFKVKEDVEKIYGFPKEIYERIYPYLALPDREAFLAERNNSYTNRETNTHRPGTTNYISYKKAPVQLFDINKADTTQLRRIRGIGSKRAQWIVNYRARLGGFASTAQIGEVFGLDSAIVDSVQKYTFVSPDFSPKPIYINTITAEELGRHPYFNFKAARAIIAYRQQHGNFRTPDDLLKVKLVKPDMIRKAQPYLQF